MHAEVVLAGVELRGDARRGLGPVVERRGDRELLVPDRGQPSVPRGAERDALLLLLAVAVGREHLRPGEHRASPGRPTCRAAIAVSVTCGHTIALAPNPPPTKCVMTRTWAIGRPSSCGHRLLGGPDALRRLVERQPAALPDGDRRRRPRAGCGGWPPSGRRPRPARRPAARPASTSPRSLRPGISPPNSRSASYGLVAALVDRRDRRAVVVADAHQRGGVLRLLVAARRRRAPPAGRRSGRRRPASGRSSRPAPDRRPATAAGAARRRSWAGSRG